MKCLALSVALVLPLLAANPSPDPFATPAHARVFVFARTDCPLTNRYAPELWRIAAEFAQSGVEFWIVYPDAGESAAAIQKHMAEYHLPGRWVADPHHDLVRRAEATVAPQAAVFDAADKLVYSGRIDDRFVDYGKSRPAPTVHDLENAISATLAGKPVAQEHTRAIGCFLSDVK